MGGQTPIRAGGAEWAYRREVTSLRMEGGSGGSTSCGKMLEGSPGKGMEGGVWILCEKVMKEAE